MTAGHRSKGGNAHRHCRFFSLGLRIPQAERDFALRIPGADPQLRFDVHALRLISPNTTQQGAPEALRCGSASGISPLRVHGRCSPNSQTGILTRVEGRPPARASLDQVLELTRHSCGQGLSRSARCLRGFPLRTRSVIGSGVRSMAQRLECAAIAIVRRRSSSARTRSSAMDRSPEPPNAGVGSRKPHAPIGGEDRPPELPRTMA